MNDEMKKILTGVTGVTGVVKANSFERHMLWKENRDREKPKTWIDDGSGLMEIVGTVKIDEKTWPVCISMFISVVDGQKIMFYDAVSVVVHHDMVRAWLDKSFKDTPAWRGDRLNHTNATNFHNIFR